MIREKDAALIKLSSGKEFKADIITDNMGEKSIDITTLRKETGYITYDPGYVNTGSCMSSICYINGEKGILRYRGYDIADLVARCDFIEVAYLLIKGRLPSAEERIGYQKLLNENSLLHVNMRDFFRAYPHDGHPMGILAAMVASLSAFYPELEDKDPEENLDLTVTRLLSKMRTIAAFTYRQMKGLDFVEPQYNYSYCANFLNMMFDSPVMPYQIHPETCHPLRKLLLTAGMRRPVFLTPMRQRNDEPGSETLRLCHSLAYFLFFDIVRSGEILHWRNICAISEIDQCYPESVCLHYQGKDHIVVLGILSTACHPGPVFPADSAVCVKGPDEAFPAFVQDVVVGCKEYIYTASGHVFCIFIWGTECRIAGVWFPGKGEFHVGHSNVSFPDILTYPAETCGEIETAVWSGSILYLSLVQHYVTYEHYCKRVVPPGSRMLGERVFQHCHVIYGRCGDPMRNLSVCSGDGDKNSRQKG